MMPTNAEHAAAPDPAPAVQGFLDRLGDRLRLSDRGATEVEVLRLRPELTTSPLFETAVRRRVDQLAGFSHPNCVRTRSVSRLPAPDGRLLLVSDAVDGWRLSEVLDAVDPCGLEFHPNAVLFLVRQLLGAVASLHNVGAGISHGALGTERLILTPSGRLVVTESVFGGALRCLLPMSRERLWRELRLAVADREAQPFGQLTDLRQIGIVALSLALGRHVRRDEYPGRLAGLLDEPAAARGGRGAAALGPALRAWLPRVLSLTDELTSWSVADAQRELSRVVASDHHSAFEPTDLDALITRVDEYYAAAAEDTAPIEAPAAPATGKAGPTLVRQTERLPGHDLPSEPAAVCATAAPPPEPRATAPSDTPLSIVEPHQSPVVEAHEGPPAPPPAADVVLAHETPWVPEPELIAPVELPLPVHPPIPVADVVLARKATWVPEPGPVAPVALPPSLPTATARVVIAHEPLRVPEPEQVAPVVLPVPLPMPARLPAPLPTSSPRPFVPDHGSIAVTPLAEDPAAERPAEPIQGGARRPMFGVHETNAAPEDVPAPTGGRSRALIGVAAAALVVLALGGYVALRPASTAASPGPRNAAPPSAAVATPPAVEATPAPRADPRGAPPPQPPTAAPAAVSPDPPVPTGTVEVTSAVALTVSEGGRAIGSSGQPILIPQGNHTLSVGNDELGFRADVAVNIKPGRAAKIEPPLPTGAANLNATPWAEVWIDGKKIGETPLGGVPLKIGTHEVQFRHPELGNQTRTLVVTTGTAARLSVDMKK